MVMKEKKPWHDEIPDIVDALVEAYQGKHGIVKGYVPAEKFDEYSEATVLKYFKALGVFVNRAYDKIPKEDTNLINQIE